MQLVNLVANGNGVSGVVSTAVAGNNIRLCCQKIGYAAFSFISPLGANDNI